jgi:hypothetical protein
MGHPSPKPPFAPATPPPRAQPLAAAAAPPPAVRRPPACVCVLGRPIAIRRIGSVLTHVRAGQTVPPRPHVLKPPDLDLTDQIRPPRVKPATAGQPPLWLGGFAKKASGCFRFASRSSHRSSFFAVRSSFLRFSPGSLVFLKD